MKTGQRLSRTSILVVLMAIAAVMTFCITTPALAGKDDPFISFNTAPAEDFMKIQIVEVPEAVARAIVSYREANGPFKTPEDLHKVSGMTDDLYDALDPIDEEGDIVFEKAGGPGGMNAY